MSILPGGDAVRLTDSQRRHLALLLDRLIRETRDRLEAPGLSAVDDRDGTAVRDALEKLLREAEDAAGRLGLRMAERNGDVRREMAAWSTSWWSTVLDARPAALRAYGRVDEEAAEVLAVVVDRLADRLYQLVRLTENADNGNAGP
ncbi:MAG: hypothetical protein P8099_06650 [Gemmatimonadota bacterium]|jgi:hypothetical protein